MAGWSPRADMAALRADRAVAMRCAFGSESEGVLEFMVCFLSGLRQNAEMKAGRKSGGVTARGTANPDSWSGRAVDPSCAGGYKAVKLTTATKA
jgi:hypothetical protein